MRRDGFTDDRQRNSVESMSLFTELKRRRVIKVAAVYAVTAWLLVQVVTAIENPLNLPGWADTLVIVLLGIGFPVALILSWAFDVTPDGIRETPPAVTEPRRAGGAHWLPTLMQSAILIAVAFLVAREFLFDAAVPIAQPASPATATQRLSVVTQSGHRLAAFGDPASMLAVSSDGQTVAFTETDLNRFFADGTLVLQLATRRLNAVDVHVYDGTDGAVQPFFSPNGEWVGYFTTDGTLVKLRLSDGSRQVVATDAHIDPWSFGVWTESGQIVFTGGGEGIYTVSENGGEVRTLIEANPANAEFLLAVTGWIPGTDYVLFASGHPNTEVSFDVEAVSLDGQRRLVVADANYAEYVPGGYLLFSREDGLQIAPFDVGTLSLTGPAVPVPDRIARDADTSATPQVAVAGNGTLVYVPDTETPARPVFVSRDGDFEPLPDVPAGNFDGLSVAGDGRRVALQAVDGTMSSILIYDVDRGTTETLSADTRDGSPAFSPDSRQVLVASSDPERRGLFIATRGSDERRILVAARPNEIIRNASWHPDGALVAYTQQRGNQHEIRWIGLEEGAVSARITGQARNEYGPRFSPDGRWLAYTGIFGTERRVMVRSFPDGQPVTVSSGAASNPEWSRDGSEIYFFGVDGVTPAVMRVSFGGETEMPEIGPPEPLFPIFENTALGSATYVSGGNYRTTFGELYDGRLVMLRAPLPPANQIVVVQNWVAEVEAMTAP